MAEETVIDPPGFPVRPLADTGQCFQINSFGQRYEALRQGRSISQVTEMLASVEKASVLIFQKFRSRTRRLLF